MQIDKMIADIKSAIPQLKEDWIQSELGSRRTLLLTGRNDVSQLYRIRKLYHRETYTSLPI